MKKRPIQDDAEPARGGGDITEEPPETLIGLELESGPADLSAGDGIPSLGTDDASVMTWKIAANNVYFLADQYHKAITFRSFSYEVREISWTQQPAAKAFTSVHPGTETADLGWKWSNAHRYQICMEFAELLYRLQGPTGRIELPQHSNVGPSPVWIGPNDTLANGYADNGGGFQLRLWAIEL